MLTEADKTDVRSLAPVLTAVLAPVGQSVVSSAVSIAAAGWPERRRL